MRAKEFIQDLIRSAQQAGTGVQNIIAEIYCTTAAIGGIYINFINAQ